MLYVSVAPQGTCMLTSLPYPRKIDMGANVGCLGIVGQDPIQDLQLRMPFRRMDPKALMELLTGLQ